MYLDPRFGRTRDKLCSANCLTEVLGLDNRDTNLK